MLMEGDPFLLIEGMAICAFAVGAAKGYIYSRSEYPHANRHDAGPRSTSPTPALLGSFNIELRVGAGAYVCGEETALLDSLEGKRGQVRAKPPLPAHRGLFGKPTVVNNLLSLATAPLDPDARRRRPTPRWGPAAPAGTMPIQLAGNVARPGLYEAPFGLTLRQIVEDIGGGTATGRPVRAVQCGGPLGAYFPPGPVRHPLRLRGLHGQGRPDRPRRHRGVRRHRRHGRPGPLRLRVLRRRELRQVHALPASARCAAPRSSTRITAGQDVATNLALVEELCETLKFGSLCALGGFTPIR
jgi:formate dehydrogenase iron-sulfur subunit